GTALASSVERERFRLEARVAASLEHPHIVPIYEVGREDDYDYYSMALVVGGGTLGAHMGKDQFGRREAVELVVKVARAVQVAHHRGIIHRDLKPDNILLDEHGEPHVSDFGLACRLEQESTLTLSGQIMGTPQYMAPEQADDTIAPITTAADQYSLGTVLYELLAGIPTFRGDSILQTLRMVATASPKPLRQHDPSIDRDLETIVLRTLEKKPADRYDSLGAFADDLEAWLEHRPIAARPPTTRERIFKWMRRRPVHAALVGTAVLLILTLGIGGPITAARQASLREEADAASREAQQQSALNRRLAYAANMNLAGVAMYDHTLFPMVQGQLGEWRPNGNEPQPDLRGWEWYYFASFADQSTLAVPPQGEPVRCLELSPSGKVFACLLANAASFQIWETATARLMHSIESPQDTLVGIAWDPSGEHLATASKAGMIEIWSAASWELVRQMDLGVRLNGVAWRSDGREITVCAAE
ncbi:MAG: protein kinase, partial [bacterium]|nr:protein kinase [bacterium]